MNSRRVLALLALMTAAALPACDNDELPAAPPPPPQITTQNSWTRSQGLPHDDVYSILVTSEGELWIGTQAGIAVYPSITSGSPSGVFDEINGPLPNRAVRAMVEHEGRIYVATWGGGIGIFDMAADTWSSRGTANGLRAAYVTDLAASATENKVYCATTDGVSIYNVAANNFASFIPPDLLDPVVSAVAYRIVEIDTVTHATEVERWYGPRFESVVPPSDVNKHGITVSRGTTTVFSYNLLNSAIAEVRVNDIFYDAGPDVFWVAFTSSGLARVDPAASTWTYYTAEDGLPSNLVYSVTRAAGTMWAATQGGLARMESSGRWQGYDRGGGLQADRVRRVYSEDGEHLWLGFVEAGAARVNPGSAQ